MNPLLSGIMRKCHESLRTQQAFFETHASGILTCAERMNDAFLKGGRLFAMGNGGSACDAQHIAVEFMHPIFEKRAALPALALTTDMALISAVGNDQDFSMVFANQLNMLGRRGDIALGISSSGNSANVQCGLEAARDKGMLTVGFAGRDGGRMGMLCDHLFVVPSFSIHRIQEGHVMLLHILWDTLHVLSGAEDSL